MALSEALEPPYGPWDKSYPKGENELHPSTIGRMVAQWFQV